MARACRIVGILFVAFTLLGVGVSLGQEKPAAGQDKKESATAADPLTGDWAGSVKRSNGETAFTMRIKLENDKFSGEIGSQEGSTPLSGTWTDGKFSANFDYNGTTVTMTGTIKDAALTGEMSLGAAQPGMNWTAKKK